MNRYHRGSSPIAASRLGSAHVEAQLKVENPIPLRTTRNFDYCHSPGTSYRCRAITCFTGNLIKNQTSAIQVPVATQTLHAKRAPNTAGEGLYRRERRRPVRLREAPEEVLGRLCETRRKVFWTPTKTGTDESQNEPELYELALDR
jgi:hypothetical protein